MVFRRRFIALLNAILQTGTVFRLKLNKFSEQKAC